MKEISVLPIFKYKKQSSDIIVSTVSNSQGWNRQLSPFILGPCKLYDGYVSQNMENAWQFSKVYKLHTDRLGNPKPRYFDWAVKGWEDKKAHRYPMGKGAIPEYSYWKGKKLDYIQARKRIYGPLYIKAVIETGAWETLISVYENMTQNNRLVLLDYDAYDHASLGLTLSDVLNDPTRKMGHAFLLAMLLQDDPALNEIKVKINGH